MIHPTAIISAGARIGAGVRIGPYTIIHENVEIGENTEIGSHCEIGCPTRLSDGRTLKIGKDSLIRSHSIFYEGSEFGEQLVTGHRVTVRELTIAGLNLQIGTLSDVQGNCRIGDYVRLHSNVHVGQRSAIGNFVWLFPYVVLTNDPHPPSDVCIGAKISDYAAIATMSVILPGVTVGERSLVAAHSCVKADVASDTVVGGSPARFLCATSRIRLQDGTERNAYPWTAHFHRGYPEAMVKRWTEQTRSVDRSDSTTLR